MASEYPKSLSILVVVDDKNLADLMVNIL